jgi:hypothetical protein
MPASPDQKRDHAEAKHVVFAVEVPVIYTEDIDIDEARREYFPDSGMSDSEILLNHIGEPGLVKLTTEVSGDKDSEVIEVLGVIRSASLEDPSPGLDDDDLQEQAWKLQPEQDELIEAAVRRLRREKVPLAEIIELLEGEVEEIRRRISREEARSNA